MPETVRPYEMLRELLQGAAPSRPLFAPIAFAMASRIENLGMPAFLTNPTKISNALRHMRPLRFDAVTCYFDPTLEADALATMESERPNWFDVPGTLEEITRRGRIPVAVDVIRRMKGLLREETLLLAVISGPLTLAARANLAESESQLAVSLIIEVAKAFAEAGASLIFVREEGQLLSHGAAFEVWKSSLTPIFNTLRFYQALPVLQLTSDEQTSAMNPRFTEALVTSPLDGVVCLPLTALQSVSAESRTDISGANLGISLPDEALATTAPGISGLNEILVEKIREFRPAIVTTASDLPTTTDPKRVAALSDIVRNAH